MKHHLIPFWCIFFFSSLSGSSTKNPKILFHGGGGGAPRASIDLSPLQAQFQKNGIPKKDLYLVQYPHSEDLEDIIQALRPQIANIISRYSSETQFDLIGHSLGHVVSLVSMAQLDLLSKIKKLIGLAGVMFGQYGKKPGLCGFQILAPYFCGDIFDLLLGTTEPPFLMTLLERHAEEINRIEKCSLYSPEDGVLDPYDSGAFLDGINVSLPDIHHIKFKSSPVVFEAMIKNCYQKGASLRDSLSGRGKHRFFSWNTHGQQKT